MRERDSAYLLRIEKETDFAEEIDCMISPQNPPPRLGLLPSLGLFNHKRRHI